MPSLHQLETPVGIRSADESGQTNRENPRQAAILSPALTLARPTLSSQVIENKNTIGMNETREAQNRRKYPENMAYHGIS